MRQFCDLSLPSNIRNANIRGLFHFDLVFAFPTQKKIVRVQYLRAIGNYCSASQTEKRLRLPLAFNHENEK